MPDRNWSAHDTFTIRRLTALRDTLATIANDVTLAEPVRQAAWQAWDVLRIELEALEGGA